MSITHTKSLTNSPAGSKPPVYLLDTMAFIFRAYHAMQRSRPMTTRTGVPTAATYVFVNMINKLRADFQPEYLAAVYDVGAPVHRNETAAQLKDVQKFNIKTQQFEAVEYGGYKANRAETPADLLQQQPYIRRALEAFRIPVVYEEGYEADDVIGTMARQLADEGHHVYVVSPDKDMMQLVTDRISILNPTKDNLVLDPAGVETVLGVSPERVIDVMALRGDAIDNVPGAPGIGDKGSVELIQQFGSLEAALDRADEVKKKTYRESLQNNRENILLSKELVTIHTSVPVAFTLESMRTQAPDVAACRALFTELEFTTMLKELAPDLDARPVRIVTQPTAAEIAALLGEAKKLGHIAVALRAAAADLVEEVASEEIEVEAEPAPAETMSLFGSAPSAEIAAPTAAAEASGLRIGLAVEPTLAIEVALDAVEVRAVLTDAAIAKQVHDLKAVLRAFEPHGVQLAGPITDVMLESYLLNPTHSSHTLADIAARSASFALKHQPSKEHPQPAEQLAEAAAAVVRLVEVFTTQLAEADAVQDRSLVHDELGLGGAVTKAMLFGQDGSDDAQQPMTSAPSSATHALETHTSASGLSEQSTLAEVYTKIDLPLVPVLLRMEQVGVRVDLELLRAMSSRLAVTIDDLAERIYASSGHRFNINSPKQLGDVLFNKMELPKPMKYGKGKVISTAQDVLEELAAHHAVPQLVLEHRQLQKLKSTYLDQLPLLADAHGRIHTTFNQVGTATGRLSSTNPNLQNIPVRTAVGREIRAAFVAAPGNLLMSADYSQIELRLMAHFSQDPLLLDAYRTGKDIHTLTASEVFGVDAETMDKETRARAKAVNFGIVYGISPFGLAAQLDIEQKTAKEYIERYFERYQGVAQFIERTLAEVRRTQLVRTAFGRVRPIPDIQSRNPNQRGFAERTAINTPLQGTAADLIKLAMLEIDARLRAQKMRSQMTLQVHDELLFDVVPEEADAMQQLVKESMEMAASFSVPIIAEVGLGQNWRDIK
jgi:DNA polymerase-1